MAMLRRLVVVTGGAQGIGRAIVQRFAEEGHRVVAADVDESAGAKLESEVAGEVKFIPADFSVAGSCLDVVKQAKEWAG